MTDNNAGEFSPQTSLKTAVLFLVFNRLDTTKQVFESIRKAKPPRLYLAADGARVNRNGEAGKVNKVREYLLENIDWPCEVKTLFRDKNLGCKRAVSSAITWFFEHEEEGIILEDDCLPAQSFFLFCETLLERYRNDGRISMISGDHFQFKESAEENSYYFTKYCHIWGWATWRRAWQYYDVEAKIWPQIKRDSLLESVISKKSERNYWSAAFEAVYEGNIDTWDYQWMLTAWVQSMHAICPSKNLISNIGFGPEATHTADPDSQFSKIPKTEIEFPLAHPEHMLLDHKSEKFKSRYIFTNPTFTMKVLRKLTWLRSI